MQAAARDAELVTAFSPDFQNDFFQDGDF